LRTLCERQNVGSIYVEGRMFEAFEWKEEIFESSVCKEEWLAEDFM
jgi:hypothetical protein